MCSAVGMLPLVSGKKPRISDQVTQHWMKEKGMRVRVTRKRVQEEEVGGKGGEGREGGGWVLMSCARLA